MPDDDLDLSFMPQYLQSDKNVLVGGGRISGRKKLGDDSEVGAYADVSGTRIRGQGTKFAVPGLGASYRKQLDKDSSVELRGSRQKMGPKDNDEVWLTYNKQFKKGGKVSSASKRADGIAQRGKTKGRML